MKYRHLMLDIETTGKEAGCNVVSVGVCEVFKPEWGVYTVLGNKDGQQGGFDDPSTLDWWEKQKAAHPESYTEFEQYKENAACRNLDKLNSALDFMKGDKQPVLWCKGAAFDYPILGHLLSKLGLDWPVKYHRFLCMRTALILAGHYKSSFGNNHNALDDARAQSVQLVASLGAKTWARIETQI